MKLIDFSEKKDGNSALQPLLDRIQELLPFLGQSEEHVRQNIIGRFSRSLDNRFTLLCDANLPPGDAPVPFILVSTTGLVVLDLSAEEGLYRAKDDTWAEMNRVTRSYQSSRRNYIKHTQTLARRVNTFLERHGKPSPEAIPVMLFAHPGVHIESKNPAIRLVLIDAVERFIASLQQSQEILKATDVKLIVDAIEKAATPQPKVPKIEASEDFFGKDLGEAEKPAPAAKPKETPQPARPSAPQKEFTLPPALDRLNFSKTQWIILVAFIIINILVLIGLILLVVFTA